MSDDSGLEITTGWLLSIGGERHESGLIHIALGGSRVLVADASKWVCQVCLMQEMDVVQLRNMTDRKDLLRLIDVLKGGEK